MNTSSPSAPSHSRAAVPLLVSSAQLTVAVVGLAGGVAYAVRDQVSDFAIGEWHRVPVPLVITGSAIVTVILLRRGRVGGAITAALIPFAAHLLVVISGLLVPEELSFGSWARQMLTLPLGQPSIQPYPVLAKITDWACMAALVFGVAVAVLLAAPIRGRRRWSPAPPGAPLVIAATSITAVVASWAGERLSVEEEYLFYLLHHAGPPRLAIVALAAAAATALADAHTRWAAREGMTAVARVSAGMSGLVMLVPLGWLLWPLIRVWLWPPHVEGYSVGEGITDFPRWQQGLAEGLTSLGPLLMLVAVVVAALTAAHRAAAAARRTAPQTPD